MLSPYYCKRVGPSTGFLLAEGSYNWNCLMFIEKGSIEMLVNGQWQTIKENQIVVYPKGVYFKRRIIDAITFYNLRFDTDKPLPFGAFDLSNHARVKSDFEYLRIFFKNKNYPSGMPEHYLQDIFYTTVIDNFAKPYLKDPFMQKVTKFVNKNLNSKLTLIDLANQMNVSKSTLVNYFNDKVGMSPMKYVTHMRINKAKQLLLSDNKTISEIATECGYENAYYFSNSFKKEVKISPTKYRKENI